MIFKLEFPDKIEFAQAKSQLHLLQEWEQEYDDFKSFIIDLDECILKTNDFSINDTFLKDKPFTTSKIPVKVLKQMQQDYKESQAYINQIIKEINEQAY